FDSSGAEAGGESNVSSSFSGGSASDVAGLSGGGYAVAWASTGDGDGSAIRLRVAASNGDLIGNDIIVNSTTTGDQVVPDVVSLGNGGFLVSWIDSHTGAPAL